MDHHHMQIPIDSDDAGWKQRCNKRMEELKNTQFPSQQDAAASQPGLLHKELGKVMIYELYNAIENGEVDNFVDVLERVCEERKIALCDIFDKVTCAGDSLLHVASDKGKKEIVELICDHFPELLIRRNVRGDTPLHVAVRSKKSTIVKSILSQHDIVKSKHDKEITKEENECGDTPLHEAVYGGNVDVVKELTLTDKDVVHYLNKLTLSPLYLAVVSGNVDILHLLLKIPFPANQPLLHEFGNSPLHAAIWERNPALIEEILAKRPELVYLRDSDGNTPLHFAVAIGYDRGLRILLEKSLLKLDQTVLERNKRGYLPIHLACKRGYVLMVKEFLEREWPINPYALPNKKGQNILHIAAENGRSNVVQYLLKNGKIDQFTINQKDNDGNTPLHLASKNLFPKVLYLILQDKRTNVNLTNKLGLTARDISLTFDIPRMLQRQFVVYQVLREARVPMKAYRVWSTGPWQQLPASDLMLKDLPNTALVVATLMVTVSFAAAFSVPGGVYSSDDPNPKNRGVAIYAHKPLFWVFTTFNTLTMYSSVIACGLLLMALAYGHSLAVTTTYSAINCLIISFLTVPVTFMSAVRLVVANKASLDYFITVIGALCTSFILFVMVFGFFPFAIDVPPFRQVGRFSLRVLISLTDSGRKPKHRKENVQ